MSIYRFAYFASMCMLLSCENDTDIILKDVPTNANELTIEETTALQLSVKGTTVPYEYAIKEANYVMDQSCQHVLTETGIIISLN